MADRMSYETDFHAWAMHNAELLRQGRLTDLDVEHIAEELESMGASERRELLSRLQVLLLHLLKSAADHQPSVARTACIHSFSPETIQVWN